MDVLEPTNRKVTTLQTNQRGTVTSRWVTRSCRLVEEGAANRLVT